MKEQVDVFLVDDEGILLRAYTHEDNYLFRGDPDEDESPLMFALQYYYMEFAPDTILCKGYHTPSGDLFWQNEMASTYGDESLVEIGERLFLIDERGERFNDEYAYELLINEEIPEGWMAIPRMPGEPY